MRAEHLACTGTASTRTDLSCPNRSPLFGRSGQGARVVNPFCFVFELRRPVSSFSEAYITATDCLLHGELGVGVCF